MSVYRRFNLVLIAIALLPMLFVGLFNVAVDPYGVINSPQFYGFNQSKPEKLNHEKLFKAIDITRIKPKTILLGASTADLGLDPTHPALSNSQPAYNLGIAGANMNTLMRYFKHTLTNQPKLQLVVLGIDLFMVNDSNPNLADIDERRLGKKNLTLEEALNLLFSMDSLERSKKTIISNINNPDLHVYYPNGLHNNKFLTLTSLNLSNKERFKRTIGGYLTRPESYKSYRFSRELLTNYKTILDICQERNINIKIFISPLHAIQLETIRVANLWPDFEEWKREVVKISPVWDFSGYNSITTEPLSEDMKNFLDSSHHTKEVGDLVLNRMFHYHEETVPRDFGVLLTPNNIESHLAKIRSDREVWAKNHPDEVKLVEDIKRNLEEKK